MTIVAQPLWLECYMLELPFDTGLPDNYVLHVKDDSSAPVENGWRGFELGQLLGIHPEPPTPQMRSTSLAFRQAVVSPASPLAALEAAFPAIVRDSQRAHPWWRRAWLRTGMHRARIRWQGGPPQARTVVAATRIAVPPDPGVDDGHWRGHQMTTALRVLNEYLESLSSVRTNLAVGPVSAPDLPPVVFGYRLRLPQAIAMPDAHAEHFAVVLHEYMPWATEPLTWAQAEQAMHVSTARDQPFMPAMVWLRNAERFLMEENPRHATIDATTAVELAVSDVVRFCAPLGGYSTEKVDNVLDGPFASRVKDHFARLLAFSAAPLTAADELGVWWRDCYLLRNQVAHRGHRATADEAGAAVLSANVLLDELLHRIRNDPRFRGVLPLPPRTS